MPDNSPGSPEHRTIIAGFGGQGILTLGKLLCLAAMSEGKQVTYLPAYGAEVRGGTAHCFVKVSPDQIFSPLIEVADSALLFNVQSLERFGNSVRPGGLLVLNTSMADADDYAKTHPVTVLSVPATERAAELGSVLTANVIMAGAFLEAAALCSDESFLQALEQSLAVRKGKAIDLDLLAFKTGKQIAEQALRKSRTAGGRA
jgi:2-oxoglutarate ferredoxin oxidoreductase subunit gamma